MASDNFISKMKHPLILAGILAVALTAALIVWLGASGTDVPDPTVAPPTVETDDTGQTVAPTEPGQTNPTEPGETNPTEPGQTDPAEPGETNPTEPGQTNPTEPGETNPTEPGQTNPTEPGETNPTEPGQTDPTDPGVTEPTQPGGTDPADPTEPGTPSTTLPGVTDPTDPTEPGVTDPTDPTEPGDTDPTDPADPTTPSERPPNESEKAKLSCDRIAAFSGRFVEDALDKPVEDVAALLVTNLDDRYLELATIVYKIDGEEANFVVTGLPPGKSCWVMEYSGKTIQADSEVTYVGSNTTFRDDVTASAEEVTITIDGNNLTATNNTQRKLKDVFIYYKSVHTDGNYFGGITYKVSFGDLMPGESVLKLGGHFTDGSEIVRVGWQEVVTDEAS